MFSQFPIRTHAQYDPKAGKRINKGTLVRGNSHQSFLRMNRIYRFEKMSNRIREARLNAFVKQKGRCFYCEVDMWELRIESRVDACNRLLLKDWGEQDTKLPIYKRKCTAEHLVKRSDKGSNQDENIVAACMDCNTRRGDMTVEEYLAFVRNKDRETTCSKLDFTTQTALATSTNE